MVAAPCLETPAVVVRYTTHFTPASASPSAGYMKRKSFLNEGHGGKGKGQGNRGSTTSVAHKLRQAAASDQGEV